ncbi:hypothetical protein POM88_038091 [Heracleum sosnowskyi]|uniref:Uncharacterized protein n=1 Tax=Heracleum sosnowskyi TaxID=360622 RepID=A0AAD8HSP1_9APIA|nr:hypothetical protein POM88_038091 [Heracleum sosnowskyi]
MESYSIPLAFSSKKVSNFQSLLESLTPNVPLRPVSADCIQIFEEDLNPSGLPITGYFFLKDIWGCWEECSAYGQGTLVKLANGQEVNQYFTPHLSAIHLMRNRRIDQKKVVTNGSTKATESWSTSETKSGDLTKGKLRDLPTGESSSNDQEECKKACFCDSSFKFYDTKRHFEKAPLFSKMQELAQTYPDLMTLRSIDMSPSSWMAIIWFPIYHIPDDGAEVKDFSASFITFHRLSSFPQDDASVDSLKNGMGGSQVMMENNKNPAKMGHPPILPLHPFALAAKNLIGDVWFNLASDKLMYNDLKKAALNWVHKRKFFHHDLNEFSWLEHSQRQARRT